jgi:hypothetical protein
MTTANDRYLKDRTWLYNKVISKAHIYTHFPPSDAMDSGVTTDTAQLSEIPKFMGFLFLPETLEQKLTCPVCLHFRSVWPNTVTTREGSSTNVYPVPNHNFTQN